MDAERIKGIIPPIVTPLNNNEDVDEEGLRKLVERCIGRGLHGIFVAGSNGETMSLTQQQRNRAIKIVLDQARNRIPVMCGVIDTSTRRVCENIKTLEEMGGEIAVVTPPFYIKHSSQTEIIQHFEIIASKTSINLIIYNIPSNTQVNILPETAQQLANIERIIGLKDSSGNWQQFQKYLVLLKGTKLRLFQGKSDLAGISLLMGADGITPVFSILIPEVFVRLYNEAIKKNVEKVFELQKIVSELNMVSKMATSPISARKFAISLLGLTSKKVTSPCEPLTEHEEKAIKSFVEHYLQLNESLRET